VNISLIQHNKEAFFPIPGPHIGDQKIIPQQELKNASFSNPMK